MTPAAPLEKAVEEAKATLTFIEENFVCFPPIETGLRGAIVALLAAIDADKRLEEAEAALREIADGAGFSYASQGAAIRMVDIARRYFARLEVPE